MLPDKASVSSHSVVPDFQRGWLRALSLLLIKYDVQDFHSPTLSAAIGDVVAISNVAGCFFVWLGDFLGWMEISFLLLS